MAEAQHPAPGNELVWSHRNSEGELTTIERLPASHPHFGGRLVLMIYDDDTPARAPTLLDDAMALSLARAMVHLVEPLVGSTMPITTSEEGVSEKLSLGHDEVDRCGLGRGSACCAFLVLDPNSGYECGRQDPEIAAQVHVHLSSMSAQRVPDAPYPECQL